MGLVNGSRVVGFDGPSRDRLVYSTTILRGHRVEVQVKDGSMYSGIFHAANIGKDMGNVLYTFGAWLHIMKLTLGKKLLYYSKRITDRFTFLLPHKYSGTAGTVEPNCIEFELTRI